MTKPPVLSLIPVAPAGHEILGIRYALHFEPFQAAVAAEARAVITNGATGLTAKQLEAMPNVGIICVAGAGYENIDVDSARGRGALITTGSGANSDAVADHAMGLLLALARGISRYDRNIRDGGWSHPEVHPRQITGLRLGLLGLGNVGRRVAHRATAFDMSVSYHSRSPRLDVAYPWLPSPLDLAVASDVLVLAVPGGPTTQGIVNRDVIEAIGPEGFLVNVGRGELVVTRDLIDALRDGRIAGAALDVVAGEPNVPEELREMPNTVLTPHRAGVSPEADIAKYKLLAANLDAYFTTESAVTPI